MVSNVFELMLDDNNVDWFIEEMIDDFLFDWYKVLGEGFIPELKELVNMVYAEVENASYDALIDLKMKRLEAERNKSMGATEILDLFSRDRKEFEGELMDEFNITDKFDEHEMLDKIFERIKKHKLIVKKGHYVLAGEEKLKECDAW